MKLEELEKNIGYNFNNISLLQTALTHTSYAYEHREKSLSFNFPLSAEARINFAESIYHVEENKESIFLFNRQGEALTSIITPNESINQLYIELDLNGK